MNAEELMVKFKAIEKEVNDIVQKYVDAGKPKTFLAVFQFLFACTGDLVDIVEVSTAVVKTNKKETVVAAMQFAYMKLDPNLPWIPEPFETKIETWFLENAVPAFVDWVVAKFNDKGIFKHAE